MAKKIKEEISEAVEAVVETVEEIVEEVKEEVIETIETIEEVVKEVGAFAEGTTVEIYNFYVRALNGIKGVVTGVDESGNVKVDIEGGTKAVFKAENLQKAE